MTKQSVACRIREAHFPPLHLIKGVSRFQTYDTSKVEKRQWRKTLAPTPGPTAASTFRSRFVVLALLAGHPIDARGNVASRIRPRPSPQAVDGKHFKHSLFEIRKAMSMKGVRGRVVLPDPQGTVEANALGKP